MALVAEIVGLLVGSVGEVDQAALGVEHGGTRFFRREPVGIRQRLDHAPRDLGRQRDVIERHHPADGQLPVLRRGAPVRNARHAVLVVGDMTGTARTTDLGVGDGNAFVGGGRRRSSTWRRLLRSDERQHAQREAAKNPREARAHYPGKTRSSLRQSFCADAHFAVQSGA